MLKNLTIVIPAFNEEQGIGSVIERINAVCADITHEIIVVNDGSQDDTARVASRAGARVINHRQNIGYGASLKSGIREVQTEFVLTMDADGQHRVEDIRPMWELAADNDMIVG